MWYPNLNGLASLLVVFGLAGSCQANQAYTPESIPGTTKVTAEELLSLVEATPDLLIIDSRVSMDRKQGYIQGSISLPDEETDCDSLSLHILSKDAPTLFYCNGVKCGRSVKAIEKAKACGYTRLYWFRGGFEEWKDKKFPYLKE